MMKGRVVVAATSKFRMMMMMMVMMLVCRQRGEALSTVTTTTMRGPPRMMSSTTMESLPPALKKLVTSLQMLPDDKYRYKQLLFWATHAAAIDPGLAVPENKVPGCLSTVYVHATMDGEGFVTFVGDSDAQLTKGLVNLLVKGLSGSTPEDIAKVDPAFIKDAGIAASLTPGRNNGFVNMLGVMKAKAAGLRRADALRADNDDEEEEEDRHLANLADFLPSSPCGVDERAKGVVAPDLDDDDLDDDDQCQEKEGAPSPPPVVDESAASESVVLEGERDDAAPPRLFRETNRAFADATADFSGARGSLMLLLGRRRTAPATALGRFPMAAAARTSAPSRRRPSGALCGCGLWVAPCRRCWTTSASSRSRRRTLPSTPPPPGRTTTTGPSTRRRPRTEARWRPSPTWPTPSRGCSPSARCRSSSTATSPPTRDPSDGTLVNRPSSSRLGSGGPTSAPPPTPTPPSSKVASECPSRLTTRHRV
mmetsp:Transcript_32666/g.104154  ORF Transcript_32666/g.104154 Transcript_32666/m.104154 type:complete len:480 (+) Transcript_32666:16-1455(+)